KIGCHPVRIIDREEIRPLFHGLFLATTGKRSVSFVHATMRVCIAQNRTLRLVLIVLRKSFVHPRMCRFVVGKHSLEPRVRGFMVDCTDRAGGPAFTHHKRTHSVFHAPIATLYHRVSLVRIWTNVLIHELKEAHRQLRETFPNLCSGIWLIEEVEFRSIRHLCPKVFVVRISSPGKVVDVARPKTPGERGAIVFYRFAGRSIAVSYRVSV